MSQTASTENSSIVTSTNSFTAIVVMVAHFSALIFPAIIIYYAVPGSSLFSWHPTLMVLGISLLMVEGIVIFSKDSSLMPNMARQTKATLHYLLMGVGMAAVLSALAVIYVNKERAGKNHFTSWHGLLGVITVGYLCAQSFGGNLLKYHRYTGKFMKIKYLDLRLYHATSAVLAFLLITATLILALQSGWAQQNLPSAMWYVCMACVSASALVITMHITSTYLPQTKKSSQPTKSSK